MKEKYFIIILFFMSIILGEIVYKTKEERKIKNNLIHSKIIEFKKDGDLEKLGDISRFKEGTKEYYLMKGVVEFYSRNIEKSYELLLKAQEETKREDLVFNIYLNFFLNNCENILKESGSIERAKYIIENINKVSELKNNTDFIWKTIITIISNEESREKSIKLLEKYIKNNGIKEITKIKIKGFIAIFKMLNEDYVESIHLFYEVISESEKIKDISEQNNLKIKSYEYIANMNFILENYEDAIEQYNVVIKIPIKELKENSLMKYGVYINKTSAYIELKDYESARKSLEESRKIISFLPKDILEGVELLFYNNLARIETNENNFKKAEEYLDKCDAVLKVNRNNGFLNTNMHIKLSYSELYIKQEKYEEALNILNDILIIDNENELGFKEAIYLLQMEIYKKLNKLEEYLKVHDKYSESNKKTNLMLKKNYLKFIKSSFEEKKLKEREKESVLKIKILIGTMCFALFGALYQALRVIKLKENNLIDQLTNVYNRKYLDEVYKSLEKNKNYSMSILMIDIDYFKKYNDNYGHLKGDIVIKTVADVLKESVDKKDSVVRYGGEEFVVILRKDDENYLKEVYNKIKNKLKNENIIHEKSLVSDRITISVGGIKGVVNNKRTFLELLKKSDEALYRAKEEGRNRLVVL